MASCDRRAVTESLSRLALGERSAINPTFNLVWPVVRAFCASYLGQRGDAEDAAQNAIIKVFERAATYDPRRDGLTWVLTIALWECRTLRRRAERRSESVPLTAVNEPSEGRPDPEAEVTLKRTLEALMPLIDRLSDEERAALSDALNEVQRANPAQRKRKQRALAQLRRWWEVLHGTA